MKIEIEFTNSYHATMVIDGREMTVESQPGMTKLEGIDGDDLENTIGGIVARRLYSIIGDIQQALAEAEEYDGEVETWKPLSKPAAEEAYYRIN